MTASTPATRRRSWQPLPTLRQTVTGLRFLPQVSLLVLLSLLVWVGLLQLSTPDVVPASAPATEFSAARAMEDLRVITAEPRAIGSPGNVATRQYLIDTVTALGLTAEVQTTSVVAGGEGGDGFGAGTVNNVIVRVPGSASTGAIAINAHYDGASTGPAASDAGSGVVAALETLRAVVAGEQLRNDLIVVFADGEENGMLGSAAFNEQHPWAQDVRLALNYEAQGSNGPAILYAVSDESGWLVSEFLGIAPNPTAYSLLPAISRLLPSARLDCDLGEYTEEGSLGLGFVYTGNTAAYHTVLDNLEEIDPGSIQQEGDYTLAVVRHFGNLDLTDLPRSSDRVFFNILPGVVVHYSFDWVLPLAAVISMLLAGLIVTGVRRGELSGKGLAAGTVFYLAATLATVIGATLLWFMIRTLNTDYQVMLIGSYQSDLYLAALIFASIAMLAGMYALARRKVRLLNLYTGALIGLTPLLWLLSLAVPGLSYLVAWPLLFAILPLGWTLLAGERAAHPWLRLAVLTLAVAPAIVLLPGTLHQVSALMNRFEGITSMPIVGLSMFFVAPLIALFLLHIDFLEDALGGRRWVIPATAAVVAVALIGWGNATSGFDADHPRPNRIAYELNADTGTAQWVSLDQNLDDWTRQFFPTGAVRGDYNSVLFDGLDAWTASAPPANLDAPEVTLVNASTDGDLRSMTLRLTSPGDSGHTLAAEITADGEIVAAAINGDALRLEASATVSDGNLRVSYFNVPAGGWELTVTVRSDNPVQIVVEDISDGLPDVPGVIVQSRPADMMPAPGPPHDPTIVKRTFNY